MTEPIAPASSEDPNPQAAQNAHREPAPPKRYIPPQNIFFRRFFAGYFLANPICRCKRSSFPDVGKQAIPLCLISPW